MTTSSQQFYQFVKSDDLHSVQQLIHNGFNPDYLVEVVLLDVVRYGSVEMLDYLLFSSQLGHHTLLEDKNTSISVFNAACNYHRYHMIKYLIGKGINPDWDSLELFFSDNKNPSFSEKNFTLNIYGLFFSYLKNEFNNVSTEEQVNLKKQLIQLVLHTQNFILSLFLLKYFFINPIEQQHFIEEIFLTAIKYSYEQTLTLFLRLNSIVNLNHFNRVNVVNKIISSHNHFVAEYILKYDLSVIQDGSFKGHFIENEELYKILLSYIFEHTYSYNDFKFYSYVTLTHYALYSKNIMEGIYKAELNYDENEPNDEQDKKDYIIFKQHLSFLLNHGFDFSQDSQGFFLKKAYFNEDYDLLKLLLEKNSYSNLPSDDRNLSLVNDWIKNYRSFQQLNQDLPINLIEDVSSKI